MDELEKIRREREKHPVVRERAPNRDELALGHAWGTEGGRDVFQMKGVSQDDRASHFYIIGASGKGKTKFIEYLIRQDMWHNQNYADAPGFAVIDPHGDLYNEVKACLLSAHDNFKNRVVLIDPTDKERSVCFNPLELSEGTVAIQQVKELVAAFEKIYGENWGPRLEALLRNTLIVLIENGMTMAEIPLLLTNETIRKKLLRNVKNETCLAYFENDFDEWSKYDKINWRQSTLNKIDAFITDERIKRIFMSPKSSIDLRDIMDNGKILLVNLSTGDLGEDASKLFGSLLVTKLKQAAMKRKQEERRPFYLYIDEFQNFAADNFVDVINETRKYNLRLTLAHQNLAQLTTKLRASVLNCGLQAYFQVSRPDAEVLAKEAFPGVFGETPPWEDCFAALQNLPRREFWFKSKQAGGMAHLLAPEVVSFRQPLSLEEKNESEKHFGEDYTRLNEDIEKEYRARMRTLFAGEKESESYFEPI